MMALELGDRERALASVDWCLQGRHVMGAILHETFTHTVVSQLELRQAVVITR